MKNQDKKSIIQEQYKTIKSQIYEQKRVYELKLQEYYDEINKPYKCTNEIRQNSKLQSIKTLNKFQKQYEEMGKVLAEKYIQSCVSLDKMIQCEYDQYLRILQNQIQQKIDNKNSILDIKKINIIWYQDHMMSLKHYKVLMTAYLNNKLALNNFESNQILIESIAKILLKQNQPKKSLYSQKFQPLPTIISEDYESQTQCLLESIQTLINSTPQDLNFNKILDKQNTCDIDFDNELESIEKDKQFINNIEIKNMVSSYKI